MMRNQTKNVRTIREKALADAFHRFSGRFNCSLFGYSETDNLLFALRLQSVFGSTLVADIIVAADKCGRTPVEASLADRLYDYKCGKYGCSFDGGLPF